MANRASDIITLVDLTDGISVVLSSESYAFPGTTTNAIAGNTTTKVQAIQGDQYVAASVVLAEITAPTGITVAKDTDPTSPTLTITIASSVTTGGEVVIPVHVGDLVIQKRFSYSIAYKGAQGDTGGVGAAAINVVQGLDATAIATDNAGGIAGAPVITIPFGGWQGTTRVAATLANPTLPAGLTMTSNTAATASADGSLVLTGTAGNNMGGADSGSIVLTYTVLGQTITRRFYWAKAKAGGQGVPGTPATSVDVRNEVFSITTDNAGNVVGAPVFTIPFAGYIGSNRAATTAAAISGLPSGLTAGTPTQATTSADGTISVTATAGSNLGGTDNGTFTLTITTNGIPFPVNISWSKAKQGSAGVNAVASGLLNEAHTIPTDASGTTLGAMTIPVNFFAYQGSTRIAATALVGTLPDGLTVGTNTAGTAGADGQLTLLVGANKTLGGANSGTVDITITAAGIPRTYKFAWSKALTGAAAISLEVVSSGGLIFKNTSVATVLTAKVYVGGGEVTGATRDALGTIKWYKNGTYLTASDGPTLTVSAGDVPDSATYEARLEN